MEKTIAPQLDMLVTRFSKNSKEEACKCTLEGVADTFIVALPHPIVPQIMTKYDDFQKIIMYVLCILISSVHV